MKLDGNNGFCLKNNGLRRLQNCRLISLEIRARNGTLSKFILEGF